MSDCIHKLAKKFIWDLPVRDAMLHSRLPNEVSNKDVFSQTFCELVSSGDLDKRLGFLKDGVKKEDYARLFMHNYIKENDDSSMPIGMKLLQGLYTDDRVERNINFNELLVFKVQERLLAPYVINDFLGLDPEINCCKSFMSSPESYLNYLFGVASNQHHGLNDLVTQNKTFLDSVTNICQEKNWKIDKYDLFIYQITKFQSSPPGKFDFVEEKDAIRVLFNHLNIGAVVPFIDPIFKKTSAHYQSAINIFPYQWIDHGRNSHIEDHRVLIPRNGI